MQKQNVLIYFFIFLVFTLIISSSVQAAQLQQFTTGYSIKYPEITQLKINEDYDFNFHVFNISNGMPITSDTQCFFHLYNIEGEHLLNLTTSTPTEQFDYAFEVKGGNFSEVGDYSYILQCNNSAAGLGGFTEQPIIINSTGTSFESNITIVFFIFLALAIGFLIFGYAKKEYLFLMFSGFMFIGTGVTLFITPITYLSSFLNTILCLILWGIGSYLLIRTSYEISDMG